MSSRRPARVSYGLIESLEVRCLLSGGVPAGTVRFNGHLGSASSLTQIETKTGLRTQFFTTWNDGPELSTLLFRDLVLRDMFSSIGSSGLADADRDGRITMKDFERLAANFGRTSGVSWSHGDFDFNGKIDALDFERLGLSVGLFTGSFAHPPEAWAQLADKIAAQPTWLLADDGTLSIRSGDSPQVIFISEATLSRVRILNPANEIHSVRIDTGAGNDVIRIDVALPSTINGGAGDDTITGGPLADRINGNLGNDTISGGAGNDIIDGGAGDDSLFGDDGHDLLRGGSGRDVLHGRYGNDTLIGGHGSDLLIGGGGTDTFDALDAMGYRDRIWREPWDRPISADPDDLLQ